MSEPTRQERSVSGQYAMKAIPINMDDYDLRTVDGCFRLLQRIAAAALHGEIGSRTHGSLNNTIRIILTYHSDIAKVAENKVLIEQLKARIKDLEEKLGEKESEKQGDTPL